MMVAEREGRRLKNRWCHGPPGLGRRRITLAVVLAIACISIFTFLCGPLSSSVFLRSNLRSVQKLKIASKLAVWTAEKS